MRKLNPTTYQADIPHEIPFETVIGDEKQADFYPRIKLKAWDNEANLSMGVIGSPAGAQVTNKNQQIDWHQGNTTARFYSNAPTDIKPTSIRVLKHYDLSPAEFATQNELGHNVGWTNQTIEVYSIKDPVFVYYGLYPASRYLDLNKVEQAGLSELRISPIRAASDPMYVDNGLKIIDIQYVFDQDRHKAITANMTQAITEVLVGYGIEVVTNPDRIGKFYFKHIGQLVKFASVAQDVSKEFGHFFFYINIDCDYNQAYDYYLEGKAEEANRDTVAYGLKSANPDIDETLVDQILARYSQLAGLPLSYEDYNDEERQLLNRLTKIHTDKQWVREGLRDDPYMSPSPKDGLEFDVILDHKPASSAYEFSITTKNLEFYHQPALTDEEKAAGDCRSPHITDSYAVYHKSEKNNEYKTGKAFHIYRPVIYDSQNWRVFGKLSVDADAYKIIVAIPQDFLDNAIYPITIDPTLGYTTAGATNAQLKNRITGQEVTGTPAVVNSMVAYIGDPGDGTARHKVGIYRTSDNVFIKGSAEDTTLRAVGGEWVTFNSVSSQVITAVGYAFEMWGTSTGSQYQTATFAYYDSSTGPAGIYKDITYVNGNSPTGWPNPITWTGSLSNRLFSVYVNYTAITVPTTNTAAPFSITSTSAGLGGFSLNPNNGTIDGNYAAYIAYNGEPGGGTYAAASPFTGPNNNSVTVGSLTSNAHYNYRSASHNEAGYGYGAIVTFTTLPTATTNAATSVGSTQASMSGDAPAGGGATISAKGYVYSVTSTNSNPTIGDTGVTNVSKGSGSGSWTDTLTGLASNTQYSFTSYSTNTAISYGGGTSYGTVLTFTTLPTLTINKSDTTTVTDVLPTPPISVLYEPNVFDTTSVTDSIAVVPQSSISVSNSSTLTENILVHVTELHISVSDLAPLSDSILIVVVDSGQFVIATSENVPVSETITFMVDPIIDVVDNITIGDNAFAAGTTLTINVVDTSSVTENIAVSIATAATLLINTSDTQPVDENILVAGITLLISGSDSSSITETTIAQIEAVSDLSVLTDELIGVFDIPLVEIAGTVVSLIVSDTISVTESLALMQQMASAGFLEFFE